MGEMHEADRADAEKERQRAVQNWKRLHGMSSAIEFRLNEAGEGAGSLRLSKLGRELMPAGPVEACRRDDVGEGWVLPEGAEAKSYRGCLRALFLVLEELALTQVCPFSGKQGSPPGSSGRNEDSLLGCAVKRTLQERDGGGLMCQYFRVGKSPAGSTGSGLADGIRPLGGWSCSR